MVVVAVRGKEPARRCSRVLPGLAARLCIAGGLAVAGWVLGVVLASSASADELASGSGDTSTVPTTLAGGEPVTTTPAASETSITAEPANSTGHSVKPALEPAGNPSVSETSQSTHSAATATEPAAAKPELMLASVPTEATEAIPLSTQLSTAVQPGTEQLQTPEATPRPAGSGLLGGLFGSLVTHLTRTVDRLVDKVSHAVPGPAGYGQYCEPASLLLADLGTLLPVDGSTSSGGNGWHSGISVVGTAPARQPVQAMNAPTFLPGTARQLAKTLGDATATSRMAAKSGPHTRLSVAEQPSQSGKRAGAPVGGTPNGEQLPSSPAAPAGSITSDHYNAGGARQQIVVVDSNATTTQLRLIGASLDHEIDAAGRDAALPATSPD